VDASGAFLTLREAIAEHAYRLMDAHSTELLMKVRRLQWQQRPTG